MCGNNVFYHNGSMLGAVLCKEMVTENKLGQIFEVLTPAHGYHG
jgi:hypothetical protein